MTSKYFAQNLFGIKGLNIAWYGVIIGCGILIGTIIAGREANKQKLKSDLISDFLLFALPISIIGARAYYVIFQWEQYQYNPIKIFSIWEGGIAIYGGVIGGFIAAVLFCKFNKFPLLRLIDIVVPSLILGQAIGRWGNFVNQEAFGNLVTNPNLQFFPFAVYIDKLGEWHQATFFYESMWNLGVFLILIAFRYRKKIKFQGQLLAMYFVGYGLGRLWIEGLRTDSLYLFPGFRASQVLSLILIIIGAIMLIFHKKLMLSYSNDYKGKYSLE